MFDQRSAYTLRYSPKQWKKFDLHAVDGTVECATPVLSLMKWSIKLFLYYGLELTSNPDLHFSIVCP